MITVIYVKRSTVGNIDVQIMTLLRVVTVLDTIATVKDVIYGILF